MSIRGAYGVDGRVRGVVRGLLVFMMVVLLFTQARAMDKGLAPGASAGDDLAFLPAYTLAEMIRTGKVSSREVVEVYLGRIERYNKALNAIVTLDANGARKRAREADEALAKGEVWGPLHGVPVTIKDNIATLGLRTTSGLEDLAGYVPAHDATVVERLKKAGAIVLGKTNLPPLGMDLQTNNTVFGRTNNPWDTNRTTGGSSGGEAAAVAAGLTAMGLGNDIGGSIRIPAHFCGIYGLKPTENFTSIYGVSPGLKYDGVRTVRHMSCSGPLARSIEDLRLGLAVIAGPDKRSPDVPWVDLTRPAPVNPKDLRIVWTDDFGGVAVDSETRNALRAFVERLSSSGFAVRRLDGDIFRSHLESMRHEWEDLYRIQASNLPKVGYEQAWTTYGRLMDLELGYYQPSLFRLINYLTGWWYRSGVPMISMVFPQTHERYMKVLTERDFYVSAMDAFFEKNDVFICPVSTTPAFHHIEPWMHFGPYPVYRDPVLVDGRPVKYLVATMSYTSLFNLTGNPVVVMPVGYTKEGLPIGVQVVGRRWRDMELLSAAEQLDRVVSAYRRPPGY